MNFAEWEPIYQQIVTDFKFSREQDEAAARLLNELVASRESMSPDRLRLRIGKEITVCGDALSLEAELRQRGVGGTIMAADGATSTLLHTFGRVPDIIVTDLDGDIADLMSANAQGAVLIIHAHGDNMDALRKYVPRFSGLVMATTQVRPFGHLYNFGGFTDGDRAVILAKHLGAINIQLVGFDFDTPRPKEGRSIENKKRKLAWARHLIYDLTLAKAETT